MSVAEATLAELPRLVFFHSALSGNCRRVEGFLAQVLQRRRNHGTFNVVRVAEEERPDLLERFGSRPCRRSSSWSTKPSRAGSNDLAAAGRSRASSLPG